MKRQKRKTKPSVCKRLLAGAVALLVAVALVAPQGASLAMATEAEEDDIVTLAAGDTVKISDAASLSSAFASTGSNGEILQLTDDISTTSTLTVVSGVNVTLDLNGYSITNNGSSSVITVNSGGTLHLTDNNESGNGNGIITGGSATSGGGVNVSGTFTMEGGTISGNTAFGSSSTTVVTGGGGVYVANGSSFTMTGGTISDNTVQATDGNAAVTGGGGICAGANTTIALANCEVSYNKAYSAVGGGGIYTRGTVELGAGARVCANTLTAQTYGNNGDGGGIYTTIADSTIIIHRGVTISGNQCEGAGGGIYCYNGTVNIGEADTNAPDAGNTQIIGNTSLHMGGGIGVSNGAVTLTDTEIYGNQTKGSDAAESDSTGSHGGGVYCEATTSLNQDSRILSNTAGRNGGGIYDGGHPGDTGEDTTTLYYCYVQENEALGTAAAEEAEGTGNGGGIYTHHRTDVSFAYIYSNKAANDGGGVYSNAATTMTRTQTMYNEAGNDGGGIYSHGDTTVSESHISSNDAIGDGGGLYSAADTVITNTEIQNNCTAGNGGGIYIDNSKLTLTTDSASGVLDGFPTMTTSDITGNRAGYDNSAKQEWIADKNSHGGGVYIEPPESGRAAAGEFDISGNVTIKDNEASSGTENVWLFTDTADQTITIVSYGLTSAESSVGVSTEEVPTVTSDVQFTTDEAAAGTDFYTDHAMYFFSDKGYGIRADTDDPDGEGGEYLELYLKPADVESTDESAGSDETTPSGDSDDTTSSGDSGDTTLRDDSDDTTPDDDFEDNATRFLSAKTDDVSTAGWWTLLLFACALIAGAAAVLGAECRSKRR